MLRKRKTKNKSQRDTLKHYYSVDRYPSQEKMSELALKLKLSYYQVYKWFWEQNRKQGSEKAFKGKCDASKRQSAEIYSCIEIIFPKYDFVSKQGALNISEIQGLRLVLLK